MVISILTQKHKKGQGWGIDLMLASIIFLLGIFSIYVYSINSTGSSEQILDSLKSQAELSSSLILSEGVPKNWEGIDNTRTPGIITDGKINQTKLERFYNITETQEDYQVTKNKIDVSDEFYFNFTNIRVDGNKIEGIGKKPSDPKNLFKLERTTIHNNKIKKFNIYIWN